MKDYTYIETNIVVTFIYCVLYPFNKNKKSCFKRTSLYLRICQILTPFKNVNSRKFILLKQTIYDKDF